MLPAMILDGDIAVPDPTHLGWNLHAIVVAYAAVATLSLAQIYESLSGESHPVACVKELSDRIGRLTVLFIDQTAVKVYTPQRYKHFPPLALTYSPASNLFGMVAHKETHHDYIYYMCAHLIRIEDIADVPQNILYPYITQVRKARDEITKLNWLDRGMQELNAGAREMGECHIFGPAIQSVVQMKREVSGPYAISLIQQKFACKKLSMVDTDGVACATQLIGFLKKHGGDVSMVHTLHHASGTVMRELDVLMAMPTVNGKAITDNLLGSMKSKTDMVAREFTEKMMPYVCVENDIYPWTTVSSLDSGAVSPTYPRHTPFSIYKNNKIQFEVGMSDLMAKLNKVPKICIDPTTSMYNVVRHNKMLQKIADGLDQLTQNSACLPDTSVFRKKLEEAIQRGRDYDAVLNSLSNCELIELHTKDALSLAVNKLIGMCERLPLQTIVSMDLSKLIAVGKALHHVGTQTRLQNARFDLPPSYSSIVHALLGGDPEHTLQVKFIKKNIDIGFLDSQPLGDNTHSPFKNALCEWTALMTKVRTVAKKMTDQMLKFTDFSDENPKLLLSRKLHPVPQYEMFVNQVQCWDITDAAKTYLHTIMCGNLKLINVLAGAFRDQENDIGASMRLFTSNTYLTYTLSERDSLLSAILTHSKPLRFLDEFKSANWKNVDGEPLALTYAPDTTPLQVRCIESLMHYMFSVYETSGEYGCIIHHLSESRERIALLQHIVEGYMRMTAEAEADAQRVRNICTKYMQCFEKPYQGSTACIEFAQNTHLPPMFRNVDSLLAASSIQNNIVANRMLQGTDLDITTVKIDEFARALQQHRLYILTHRGETLAWGNYFPADKKSVTPHQEWREQIISKIISNTWNVNIREIIDLHTGVYHPTQMSVADQGATFFICHGQGTFVMCGSMIPDPQTFPRESHDIVTFGGLTFSNNGYRPVAQSFNGHTQKKLSTESLGTCNVGGTKPESTVLQRNTEVIVDGLAKLSLSSQQSPQQFCSHNSPSQCEICLPNNDRNINVGECSRKEVIGMQGYNGPLVLCGMNGYGQANSAIPSACNTPSAETHTGQPPVVEYAVRVNPWNIFVNQGTGVDNPMYHLLQGTIQLSSSSDGSDDN